MLSTGKGALLKLKDKIYTSCVSCHCAPLLSRRGESIVMSMSVCLSVRSHLRNHMANVHQFFVPIFCGHGSVLLRWHCNMLCTSSCVDHDDIMFGHNAPYGASCVFLSGENVTAKITALIQTKFCSTMKISRYTSWAAHWG